MTRILIPALACTTGLVLIAGCSKKSSGGPASPGSFTIAVSPSTAQTVVAGSSLTFTVTVTPKNGFKDPVVINVTGAPAGVTPAGGIITIPAGSTSTQLVLDADLGSTQTTTTTTFQGVDANNNTITNSQTVSITVFGAPGELAGTFGTNGVFVQPAVNGSATIFGMAFQPGTGKLIVGGSYSQSAVILATGVARIDPATGALDTSFGTGGIAEIYPVVGQYTVPHALAIFPDGRIALGGYTYGAAVGNTAELAVMVLTSNGALDTSFNGTGLVQTTLKAPAIQGNYTTAPLSLGIGVDAANNVVVAGVLNTSGAVGLVQRYTQAGVLDAGFGTGGTLLIPFTGSGGGLQFSALAFDGNTPANILACGNGGTSPNQTMVLARISDAGSIDAFATGVTATNGLVHVSVNAPGNNFCNSLFVQPDGNIVLGGGDAAGQSAALVRLLPTGAPDISFGSHSSGLETVTIGGEPSFGISAMVLAADGTFYASVTAANTSGVAFDMWLAKFDSNGLVDPTFNQGSPADYPATGGTSSDFAFAVAIDPATGFVFAGGSAQATGSSLQDWAVLKYWP